MTAATLTAQGEGRFALSGELSFATVVSLLATGRAAFAGLTRADVDLSAISHADSAGLGLLLEWQRLARAQGLQLHYHAIPAQLSSLAAISEVAEFLA